MFVVDQSKPFNAKRLAAVLMPACLMLALNSPLLAAPGDTWLLQISEKENQLAHPNDPMWMKVNMWDNSYQRMMARSMPTLELSNLQPAGGPDITQFQLTIGDTRFNFSDDFLGEFALLGNTTPGFTLNSSVSDGGNLLTVNIVGGLAPGELVRFRIDLDVDAGLTSPPFFANPDFRTVLFDMNGIQVYGADPNIPAGSEDNAQASIKFSDNTTAGPIPFVDEAITGIQSQFFNNIYRPYGFMEPVDTFGIGGGRVIPEPSSAVLVAACLIGMMLRTRTRRITGAA